MSIIAPDSPEVVWLSERDFRLRRLLERLGPLEYERFDNAFKCLAHCIIEQMLSMKAGRTIEGRLTERCGGKLAPEALASLSLEDVRACGVSLRKAKNLLALADHARAHDLEALAGLPEDEVRRELTALPGIGKWTCDIFLIFYLEFPDILPVEDGALRQAFHWLYDAPIESLDVQRAICSLWSPYASTAVRYLYRALNSGLVRELDACELLGM